MRNETRSIELTVSGLFLLDQKTRKEILRGPDSRRGRRERRTTLGRKMGISGRVINDMRPRLLSVASLMEALASLFPPRIPLHPFTRVYHACDCARSRHVPSHKLAAQLRNVSFSTCARAKRTERERMIRVYIRVRYERIRRIPRIHYARVTPCVRVCVCVSRVLCYTVACHVCFSSSRRGHTSYAEGEAHVPTRVPPDCHFRVELR